MSETVRPDGVYFGQLRLLHAADNLRVGHCWMAGRLLDGDIAMALEHAGDCFWRYVLLGREYTRNVAKQRVYKIEPASKFSAYTLGVPSAIQPTEREMHLLAAGEFVALSGGEIG
jgi:hypothetical protein